ncbi:MAG: HNH endonuclease [Panacagrimonas sp.]
MHTHLNEVLLASETAKSSFPLILVLDVTGAPYQWVSWQSAVTFTAVNRVHRLVGETRYTVHGGVSRRTGNRTTVEISSIMALFGRHPRAWDPCPPALSNPLLFSRDRNLCCYCGAQKSTSQLSRDHISPLARGGTNSWMNVVTACLRCNHVKGCRTPQEAGMSMLYVPYVPSRQEGLILRNRRILADQMDFLCGLLPKHSRLSAVNKVRHC